MKVSKPNQTSTTKSKTTKLNKANQKDNQTLHPSSKINSNSTKLIYNEVQYSLIILNLSLLIIITFITKEILYTNVLTSSFIFSIQGIVFISIYFMIIFVFILILFIIKFKKICFNKLNGKLSIRKSNIFKTVINKYDIPSIKDIRIIVKGRINDLTDLSSFFIRVSFNDGRLFDFSEHSVVDKTLIKYRQIKAFLYGEYLTDDEIIEKGFKYEVFDFNSSEEDDDSIGNDGDSMMDIDDD